MVAERYFDSLCGNLRGFLQVKGDGEKSCGESSGIGYKSHVVTEPYGLALSSEGDRHQNRWLSE